MWDNNQMVGNSNNTIGIYDLRVRYFMFIHDPDLVPFNVLPNFNIFKRYEWCYRYCWDIFPNLQVCISILLDLTNQVSYVLSELKLTGRCVWSLFTHYKAFVAPTIMLEKLSQQ